MVHKKLILEQLGYVDGGKYDCSGKDYPVSARNNNNPFNSNNITARAIIYIK